MLKNDDFTTIPIKCYQNRYQKVTTNDVVLQKYISWTLQSIADPKNQLEPCIKPTERGIVVIIMLKNDDFMHIFVKCYQNRYQKVT